MSAYREILPYLRPHVGRLLLATLAALAVSGLTVAVAWMIKELLDKVLIKQDATLLLLLPVLIVVVFVAKGAVGYFYVYQMRYIGARIVQGLRDRLFQHLVYLPVGYFTRHSSGSLISRVTNDVGLLQSAVASSGKDVLVEGATFLGLLIFAFYQKWDIALLGLIILPLGVWLVVRLGRRLRSISRKGQERMAGLTSVLAETIRGIRIVKAFGMEPFETRRFREANEQVFRFSMKTTKVLELTTPVMELMAALGIAFIIWYGGRQVIAGVTTPGTIVSTVAALVLLYQPAKRLSRVNNELQRAMGAMERVQEVMQEAPEPMLEPGLPGLAPFREAIQWQNVSFRYEGRRHDALFQVNVTIRAGEMVAVVGLSGSGKTTLANLLPRFLDPVEGAVVLDGVDLRRVSLSSLRAQIGIVSQDVVLFNDTVRSNIAYGRPDLAGGEDVVDAAKAAFAHEFILELPQGYDTIIGEEGVRLSGGQRQRLAIARALLKNPPILILDEATSSLDAESERMVQEALAGLMRSRTTLVIAHRLSTVRNADRIMVLDRGRIVEEGSHESLMGQGGLYRRLYSLQFRDRPLGGVPKDTPTHPWAGEEVVP